ncbi:DUF4159 domain-containing protein [Namhaeicola litoreus]|uniref:DUF4159 domain-containing protein n=1 Tax=Namhaeicola litoreus TaxID=1052145 RepID=A0ABW3Y287_9FLAO
MIFARFQLITLLLVIFSSVGLSAQQLAILKYEGGGDWYANPTAVPNLIKFCNENINTKIDLKIATADPSKTDIYAYPILFMTGHGNVFFNDEAVKNLRAYLSNGGFLHISDNYGIDLALKREMKKVFPDLDFIELPNNHPIYHQKYNFDQLPKIHEHDNKPPQGLGLILEGRLVCFYDYESDLSDGWENEEVHNDSFKVRLEALKMGANIVSYAFTN